MQILIWGDEMKRKISICIIVLLAVIVLILAFTNTKKEAIPEETGTLEVTEDSETVLAANTDHHIHYAYLVRAKDQKLVVYCSDGKTIYFETGIAVRSLSESMQQKAEDGIGFFTEADLYDFLEGYSS